MPTTDGFDPAPPLPRFLDDQTEQGNIGNAVDGGITASRVFKASLLIASVAAIGITALSAGNPVALFADVAASLTGNPSPQPGTDQSTPAIRSAADAPAPVQSTAEAAPPTTNDTPRRDEVAASEAAAAAPTEKSEPPSEALFRQFQAWLTVQDAQARAEAVQPVQDSPEVAQNIPAPAPENAQAQDRPMQKRRQVRAAHSARAEMHSQTLRKQHRRTQAGGAERPPMQDARAPDPRAPDPSVQNAQAASFPPLFGQRN